MIKLDKTKAYDLRDLNDEQLTELLDWLKVNDKGWDKFSISLLKKYVILAFKESSNQWVINHSEKETTNALDLFLKIGDTLEYNGYICEVKKPIKIWVYDTYLNSYYKVETINSEYYKEITNQTLIKLLEENAIH